MSDMPPAMTDPEALRARLELLAELLAAKDRELAAKEETLALMREKIARLERVAPRRSPVPANDPMEGFRFVSALEDPWAGAGGRSARSPQKPRPQAREEPPKGMWARFYHWFREA